MTELEIINSSTEYTFGALSLLPRRRIRYQWDKASLQAETDIRQNNMYHYKSNGNSALIEKVQRHERLLRSSGR